jgi:hypothetical protein
MAISPTSIRIIVNVSFCHQLASVACRPLSVHILIEEDDTCIEKNKITVNQPLNKQMGRILKCEQITDDRQRTPTDGKSSH